MKILFLVVTTFLISCAAKKDDKSETQLFAPVEEKAVLAPTIACDMNAMVNGKITGQSWEIKSAVAFPSGFAGMWDISLFETPLKNPCREFGSARGIMLRVPQAVGESNLLNEKVAVFYDMNKNPQLSINTTNGRVIIQEITPTQIKGSLEGYFDQDTGACGQFNITRCE